MGATKSKVDCPHQEETESPSQTSESTSRGTSSRQRYGRRKSKGRKWRHSDKDRISSTPSPDETLLKPFTYQTRKDRLLESLQSGGDQRYELSSENGDSHRPAPRSNARLNSEKISVAKMVENLQANLIVKNESNSSIRNTEKKKRRKRSKTPHASKTSSGQSAAKGLDKRVPSKTPSYGKHVMPTGMEEQIIETLIQPRKRRSSLPPVEIKDSSDSMAIHPKHQVVEASNRKGIVEYRHSPPPPPIDFEETASETESGARTIACSTALMSNNVPRQESNNNIDEKHPETNAGKGLPSHLKELKLRFSNDVPRSPYEDNLNDVNKQPVMEKYNTKQAVKPVIEEQDEVPKFKFTNDVPLVDSLHILPNDKNLVVSAGKKTTKDVSEKSKKDPVKSEDTQGVVNSKLAEKTRNRRRDVGCEDKETKDGTRKSILKNTTIHPADDDVINCFSVKTEYDHTKLEESGRKEHKSNEQRKTSRKEDRKESRKAHKSALKNSKTQTSSTGLINTSAQTWPDLELQLRDCRKDAGIQYESAFENKAKQIMRRFSAEKPPKKSPPSEEVDRKDRKKYRNGSTQWEDVDLLVTSSCEEVINKGRGRERDQEEPKRRLSGRTSRRSRSEVKSQGRSYYKRSANVSASINDEQRTEICCMHLQVLPDEYKGMKSLSNEGTRDLELLEKKSQRRKMPRSSRESEQSLCKRCSQTQVRTSMEGLSVNVNYATSSCRSRDISLLSPFCSKTTIGTALSTQKKTVKNKNEDLYRQMEELGLGFLREGEWLCEDCGDWVSVT